MQISKLPRHRQIEQRIAKGVLLAASASALIMLGWLIWRVASAGLPIIGLPTVDARQAYYGLVPFVEIPWLEALPRDEGLFPYLDWPLFDQFISFRAASAGIKAAIVGSLWLGGLTLVISLPVGVLAGVYMNEYATPGRITNFLRLSIANLAGVPSIVFGILGLALFVRMFGLGFVLLAGALTLSAMSIPVIIVATQEALKAVPKSMREAAYGLGATKWQVTKDHVLPYAVPGIMTGSILALARAMGETAPLILVGGATAIFFLPEGPMSLYSALPLQTYFWATESKEAFRSELAPAATVVLLLMILGMNLIAILLRNHYQKKIKW